MPNSIQQLLRLVRTDIDRFDAETACMLMTHGEAVALASLRSTSWAELPEGCPYVLVNDSVGEVARPPIGLRGPYDQSDGPRPPDQSDLAIASSHENERLKRIAEKGSRRTFRRLAFDVSDWRILLVSYLAAAAVFAGACLGISRYIDYRAQQDLQADLEKCGDYHDRIAHLSDLQAKSEDRLTRIRNAAAEGDDAQVRSLLDLPPTSIPSPLGSGERPTPTPTPMTVPTVSPSQPPIEIPSQDTAYGERVYIQFAGTLRREEINALNAGLRAAGWNVQSSSGERTAKAAGQNEVRYGGANRKVAQSLADAINSAKVLTRTVTVKQVFIVGDSNLEIWISR